MGGAICSEMEAATLFILGNIYRIRTGGIMLVAANQESNDPNPKVIDELDDLLAVSIEAVKILIESDRGIKEEK
jgi:uridine phosphorylase